MTHKYNGKELETRNGLNLYDYGARLYDPITGLFTSIDPLCERYYHISPYACCMRHPINAFKTNGPFITNYNDIATNFHVKFTSFYF